MARLAATGPMTAAAARRMRRTASNLDETHPETVAGGHLRDAARALERGGTEGSKRHLDAAMELLTPRNLIRHGITDDDGHQAAKAAMHQVHRHRLAVMDIEDHRARNDGIRQQVRDRRDAEAERKQGPPGPPAPPKISATVRLESERRSEADTENSDPGASAGKLVAASNVMTLAPAYLKESRNPHSGEWISGSPGALFGRHVSKSEARAFGELFGRPGHVHGGMKAPSLKEQARHAGLSKSQRVVYRKFRKKGRTHEQALRRAMAFSPQMLAAAMSGDARAVELARAYRYRHGWIPIAAAQRATALAMIRQRRKKLQLDQYGQPRTRGQRAEIGVLDVITTPARLVEKTLPKSQRQRRKAAPAMTFSARTPFLARTPAPRGRPGGPGLYDVEGMGHTPYLQQVVKALIEKRGMPSSKAYAIARAAIRKWMIKSRHPEVKSAAGAAEAGELARQARAKASHGHSVTALDVADALIELACEPIDLFNPNHAPPGSPQGGQFAPAGQGGQGGGRAAKRRTLIKKIAGLRSRIKSLEAQLPQHRRGGKSGSSRPAKKGAAAISARQAKQGKQKPGKPGTRTHARSVSSIRREIATLRVQLRADVAQLRALR